MITLMLTVALALKVIVLRKHKGIALVEYITP